ncbi:LysR substrate-binding domain-containing protein [Gluconacetobacter sacchari]|uniref:LysR substrate-binding domain-containing protein n=1 Tax=Gluconacetobacter sacchari TaxID=92759 RepID=UPI0039B6DD74
MTTNGNTDSESLRSGQRARNQTEFRRYLVSGRLSLVTLAEALTVAEMHSFRKAASMLGVMPSAVSTRISGLEDSLGYRLFDRQHGVRPTLQGHVFLDFAERALSLIAQAVATGGSAYRTNALHIALQSATTSGTQARLLEQFSLSSPDVFLIPEEVSPADLAGNLRRRRLDIALTPWVPDERGVILSRPLWHEDMLVALSDQDALAARATLTREDLAGRTFLVRAEGIGPSLMERLLPWLTEGLRAPMVEELHAGRDTLLLSVARNRALALVMPGARDLRAPGVIFRPLRGGPTMITFHAAWSRYNNSPTLRAFLKTVKTVFGPDRGFVPNTES